MKKKNKIWIFSFIIMGLLFISGCEKDELPTLTTIDISKMTQSSITCGVNLISKGSDYVKEFGVCWGILPSPTIADNKKSPDIFLSDLVTITGLSSNTTYYVRAYATNDVGTAYGNEISFTLWLNVSDLNITDVVGYPYKTVKIGMQTWMAENLMTTRYNNGDEIPNITDRFDWQDLTTGAYCNYDNVQDNFTIYGRLYNFYSVVDPRKLCPNGWHVPTATEWNTLINYLGGNSIAGSKLKDTGTVYWIAPNIATNESGFRALPGGDRWGYQGQFHYIKEIAHWWSCSEENGWPIRFYVGSGTSIVTDGDDKNCGFSVRCIKD